MADFFVKEKRLGARETKTPETLRPLALSGCPDSSSDHASSRSASRAGSGFPRLLHPPAWLVARLRVAPYSAPFGSAG
jgi:hypothetical protein